jgi:PAS domain-containing protein
VISKTHLRPFPFFVGFLTLICAVSVEAGWALNIPILRSMLPRFVAMNPVTALCFGLVGLSLMLLSSIPDYGISRRERIAKALVLFVGLIGALKVASYAFGFDIGLDHWFFANKLEIQVTPNRMAPNTALNFSLLSLAILVLEFDSARRILASQIFAMMAGVLSLLAIIGYAYGVTAFYGVLSYIPMALNTALLFLFSCCGTLALRHEQGLMQPLTAKTTGGFLSRRLLPYAVVIPIGLGGMRLYGERHAFFSTTLGEALLVTSVIGIFAAMIWRSAHLLNVADTRRLIAEAKLQHERDSLEIKVEQRTAEISRANKDLRSEMREREKVTAELERNREELKLITDALPVLIAYVDADRCVCFENKTAQNWHNNTDSQSGSVPLSQILGSENYHAIEKHLDRAYSGQEVQYEAWFTPQGRQRIYAHGIHVPRFDAEGNVQGVFLLLMDMSERKQIEEELRILNQIKSEFVMVVSHELRTPLTAINEGINLVLENDNPDSEILKVAQNNTIRLTELIKHVVDGGSHQSSGSLTSDLHYAQNLLSSIRYSPPQEKS